MRKKISILLYVIGLVLFSFTPTFFLSNTIDYKLTYFANDIIYSKSSYNDGTATIMNINKKNENENIFTQLFNNYYDNLLVFGIRMRVEGLSNEHLSAFYTLPTFSIRSEEEATGGYYLDSGLFYTYFSDDILGPRGYLKSRNNCDGFIFISDSYADQLLDKYNIDTYEELILNDKYNVLSTYNENGEEIRFCINNIVYSDKRSAPRCSELYGDTFGLFWINYKLSQNTTISFEIDLKNSVYSCTTVFNQVHAAGYTTDNLDITFRTYDNKTMSYIDREDLNAKFSNIYQNSNDLLWLILGCVFMVLSFVACVVLFFIERDNKIITSVFALLLIVLTIMCLITNFFTIYKYFYLPYLFNIFAFLLIKGKEMWHEIGNFSLLAKEQKSITRAESEYTHIEI